MIKSVKKGFTLIELIVVVAIIGALATMVVLEIDSARNKSKVAKAKSELRNFVVAAQAAQVEAGKELGAITGHYCTFMGNGTCSPCSLLNDGSSTGPSDVNACKAFLTASYAKIEQAAGGVGQGISDMLYDPWGRLYWFEENENEGGGCNTYGHDLIGSAGSNGKYEWGGGDESGLIFSIPYSSICAK